MKKLVLTLLLAVSLAIPSLCFAGDGAIKYFVIFDDTDSNSTTQWKHHQNIQAFNYNSTDAMLNVVYYHMDGSVYNGIGYDVPVPANSKFAWRPSLHLGNSVELKGCAVIKVTAGSVYMKSGLTRFYGAGTEFNSGDVIGTTDMQMHTVYSTFATMDGFTHVDNGDGVATIAGESVANIYLHNPENNLECHATLTYKDTSGAVIRTDSITIPSHGTYTVNTATLFGSTTTSFSLTVDVSQSDIIGNVICEGADNTKKGLAFNVFTFDFNKRMVIQ
jgi:hypothetical protein